MLYPKEDRINNTLMFACRTCQFSEPATASCIWRNALKDEIDDVAQDPTVGNSSDSAMDDVETIEGEDIVPEMCTLCGQEILCPICEKPTDGMLALEVDDPAEKSEENKEDLVDAEKRERALSGTWAGR